MKRENINKDFIASKAERAIKGVFSAILEKLSMDAIAYKFAHNENSDYNEIKWDVHFKEEKDALKFYDVLKEIRLGFDLDYYGESDNIENVTYIVPISYYWSTDITKKGDILKFDRELVETVESNYNIKIEEGSEDTDILQGDYYWGNVENIIFVNKPTDTYWGSGTYCY